MEYALFLLVCTKKSTKLIFNIFCSEIDSTISWLLLRCKYWPVFMQEHQKIFFSFLETLKKTSSVTSTTLPPRWQNVLSTQLQISVFSKEDIEELPHKFGTFRFTYPQVASLHILFKWQFADKIVATGEQMFDNVWKAICFSERNREMERKPSIVGKILPRKMYTRQIWVFPKNEINANQLINMCMKNEQVKETNFEAELNKSVLCMVFV